MAWSSPRTWVADEIVTKALLDTELRDNLNELALHDHSGGSGSGTRAMGGSATGLVTVYMRDGAGPGTPTGTISAVFTTGSRLAILSSGGTVVLFATAGHEHTSTLLQNVRMETGGSGTEAVSIAFTAASASANNALVATSLAVGGTGNRSVLASVAWVGKANNTASATGTVTLTRAGTALGSRVFTAHSGAAEQIMFVFSNFEKQVASGTYAYSATFSSTAIWFLRLALDVNEISVP